MFWNPARTLLGSGNPSIPCGSRSPSTSILTLSSGTPRAAPLTPQPPAMQCPRAERVISTADGPLSVPRNSLGWSPSTLNVLCLNVVPPTVNLLVSAPTLQPLFQDEFA